TETGAGRVARLSELRTRIAALPGVVNVTIGQPPGSSRFRTVAVAFEWRKQPAAPHSILYYNYVEPGHFRTLGIPVLLGAGLEPGKRVGQSAMLSESAARQIFGGSNPLGRTIRLGPVDEHFRNVPDLRPDGSTFEVVGVVGDVRGWTF